MKVDIVLAYYAPLHRRWWPALRSGFEANAAHIARLIVVNDDEPFEPLPPPAGVEMVQLSHPNEGFGLCKSLNQGVREANTDWVLIMEGDEILPPGSLARTLAMDLQPQTCYALPKAWVNPQRLPEHVLLPETDCRHNSGTLDPSRYWRYCIGGHLLIHRESHHAIEGFDEYYGYGHHDNDYGVRWQTAYGFRSLVWCPQAGAVFHIGSGQPRILAPEYTREQLARALGRLYSHRYNLYCETLHGDAANIAPAYFFHADTHADCRELGWIPPGTARLITHRNYVSTLIPTQAKWHFRACLRSLAPGGQLHIWFPDVEAEHPHFQGWYTSAAVIALLKETGFEIDDEGIANGLVRVEASRPNEEE